MIYIHSSRGRFNWNLGRKYTKCTCRKIKCKKAWPQTFFFLIFFGFWETSMATFSRLFQTPSHHLEGNSGVILHCTGHEQSSPFMHTHMGLREEEEGWRERMDGRERRRGEEKRRAVGRRSRLSFQCEGGDRKLNKRFQMFRRRRDGVGARRSDTHLSVFPRTVLTVRTSETNMHGIRIQH